MDELKLKLQTKLMRGIVAKLLMKAIYAKLGYKVGELIKQRRNLND